MKFKHQPLNGVYSLNRSNWYLEDFPKIASSFDALKDDIPELTSRIAVLEATISGLLTTDSFDTNSLAGTYFENGTISAGALEGDIPGSKFTSLTDTNFAPDAHISPSKIHFDQLKHSMLEDIGTRTHSQIDAIFPSLFPLLGDFAGPLFSNEWQLAQIRNRVWPSSLNTDAQQIGPAINELDLTLSGIEEEDIETLADENNDVQSVFTHRCCLRYAGINVIPSGESHVFVSGDVPADGIIFCTSSGLNTEDIDVKVESIVPNAGFYAQADTEATTTQDLGFNWVLLG